MPKKPIDYSKCCIYKIEHIENENLLYVGHTTCFNKRKAQHKSSCKNEKEKNYNLKVYQMIRNNGGFEMFKIIEIEKYPCKDKREAERRENECMKNLKSNMNMLNSFRTEEDKKNQKENWKFYNKDKVKEHNKKYYENHKEMIKDKVKQYQENNVGLLKEKRKEYYINNKEVINDKYKEYISKNKEQIKIKLKEKNTCECGCEVLRIVLKRHQKTKKHIDLMNKNIIQ